MDYRPPTPRPRRIFPNHDTAHVWPSEHDEDDELEGGVDIPADIQADDWNQRIANLCDNSDELCDVVFKVHAEDDESPDTLFKAHKLILAAQSPVFKAMFYGSLPQTEGEIEVPDVTPLAFKALITFIYKGEALIQSLQGAWQLWYAAKKYMIDRLEEICRRHLQTHLSPMNVLDTFVFADNYGDPQVLYQCLRMIDRNASYIISSPRFVHLPKAYVTKIVSRTTLNAKEIDIFEALIRWSQVEIKRRTEDHESDEVPSLIALMESFRPLMRFSAFASQDFVHRVLPLQVLDLETVTEIAAEIQKVEVQNEEDVERRTPIMMSGSGALDHSLRYGNVHSTDGPVDSRLGPGYYQCTRFSPDHELVVVSDWPQKYSLKFKTSKPIFVLGACITETDRQFYAPKLKYILKLRTADGKVLSEGSETVIKKTSSIISGGLPKALDYGPHDVCFKNQAYIAEKKWYELNLEIFLAESTWSEFPLLACQCKNKVEMFDVAFEFSGSDILNSEAVAKSSNADSLSPGLISRIYFFY